LHKSEAKSVPQKMISYLDAERSRRQVYAVKAATRGCIEGSLI
jgi:transcriptional regulator of met regulon